MPHCVVRGSIPYGRIVVAAQEAGGVHERLIRPRVGRQRVVSNLARDEGKYLPSLVVEAQEPGRTVEVLSLEVPEEAVHRQAPRPGGSAHGVIYPHYGRWSSRRRELPTRVRSRFTLPASPGRQRSDQVENDAVVDGDLVSITYGTPVPRQAHSIRNVAAQDVQPLRRTVVRRNSHTDTNDARTFRDLSLCFVHEAGPDPSPPEARQDVEILNLRDAVGPERRVARAPVDRQVPGEGSPGEGD